MVQKIGLILAPVDFSPGSELAAAYAFWLAGRLGARLRLFHVVRGIGSPKPAETAIVRAGESPADAIVKAAREAGADLIVMATHGRSGLRRMVLGSVAEQVVRSADCPVLTIK